MDSRVNDTPHTRPVVRTTARGRIIGAIIALAALAAGYFVVGHYLYRAIERVVRHRGGLEQS